MHIPDGYMSLQTSVPAFGAMIPIWSVAAGKVRKFAGGRQIPLLSLCAAFSFVIMMFNIPVGPSSVHAVGAVFAAVLLGPWAACIAVSVALVIQAFVFGDGGIIAIGLNCFNIAFAMPFAGYGIYRLIAGASKIPSRRSLAGIILGSFTGINLAALLTAVEFGIQPLLFKNAAGVPEYGFFPLSVSVPAIMTEHLLVAGPVEAVITAAAITYLARFSPYIFNRTQVSETAELSEPTFFRRYRAFITGLAVLIAAVPLGLLATGTAWGEWGTEQLGNMLGFVPAGMKKLSGIWSPLLPKYEVSGLQGSFAVNSLGYIFSAVLGVALIAIIMLISSSLLSRKQNRHGAMHEPVEEHMDEMPEKRGPVPVWLLEGGSPGEAMTQNGMPASKPAARGMDFFKRTAVKVSQALQEDLLAERSASRDKFMQGVDPRIKLVTIILLMVITGMVGSILPMLVLLSAAVMLVVLSGLQISSYVRRVWLVIPLLLLVFSIPAATNLLIPGAPVLTVYGGGTRAAAFMGKNEGIYFTLQGIEAAIKLFLRTGISISFGYILVMTTRWSRLAASLRSLRLPSALVGILNMTYRYIFVLVQVSREMFEARYLRTVGRISGKDSRRFLSGRIALLFVKSGDLSEEIYDSMLCRCYSGEFSGLGPYKPSKNDLLWLANFIMIIFVTLLLWQA